MKIIQATLRDQVPGLSTRMFSAEKGHELALQQGLLRITTEHGVWLVPLSNIVSLRPEPTSG